MTDQTRRHLWLPCLSAGWEMRLQAGRLYITVGAGCVASGALSPVAWRARAGGGWVRGRRLPLAQSACIWVQWVWAHRASCES